MGERIETEGKLLYGSLLRLRWERVTILSALKMYNIRWNRVKRKVIHALIKPGMLGNLDAGCLRVEPEYVASGVGQESQEDAFPGVGYQLS